MREIGIALLGCGNVGSGFVGLLGRERRRIRERFGFDPVIRRILVRDLDRDRPGVDRRLLTRSAIEALDCDCDVAVELIGGTHTAGAFVRRAIERGLDVVTANKALLAERGNEIFDAAGERGVTVGFEASVCSGIPVIQLLRHGLAGDSIERIRGIVNGTCNFVLSRMEGGYAFDDALRLAQARGFAEADPSLDIDGDDAAQKMRILASIAFDVPVVDESVRGIRGVTTADIERARSGGGVIRLVADARRSGGSVTIRVGPQELDATDVLASVRDENNALVIQGRAVGELVLTGAGAGAMPTAAAVLADVIAIGRARTAERAVRAIA